MAFFQNFKSQFKGDLGGRYFAVVLGELIRENPQVLNAIWNKIPKKIKVLDIDVERCTEDTSGVKNKRRADLSVNFEYSDESRWLNIEIKWNDAPHEGQIDDYLNKAKDGNLFMLLSLDELEEEDKPDLDKINAQQESAVAITCPEVFDRLSKMPDESWLVKEFLTFLKENAMIYEVDINLQALVRFMKNTIGFDRGFGKDNTQEMKEELPLLLKNLMGNMHKISMDIKRNYIKDIFRRNPLTNFSIETDAHKWWELGNPANEGKFCIFSSFTKSENDEEDWRRIVIGFYFKYQKGKKELSLHSFAFAPMQEPYLETSISDNISKSDKSWNFPKMPVLEESILENLEILLKNDLGWGENQEELLKEISGRSKYVVGPEQPLTS